jgi:hypothetical protein
VVPPFSAPVVVKFAHRPGSTPAAAPVPRDRDALARELQKELRRVGCYEGELNGAWTPATRAAMKAFTERINATLPVDEPDPILFTLVQGQQDKVCGKPCPTGQGLSQDGRCMPSAILAHASRKGAPVASAAEAARPASGAITAWSTTTTAAAPAPVGPAPEGRMALAGPTSAPVTPADPAAAPTDPAAAAAATPAPAAAPAPAARPRTPSPGYSQGGGRNWAHSVLNNRMSPN